MHLFAMLPMLQVSAGRAIGEQSESMWSMLNDPLKPARFMADARYRDTINIVLELRSILWQDRLAQLLESRIKKNTEKLGACTCSPRLTWMPVCLLPVCIMAAACRLTCLLACCLLMCSC